MPLLLLNEKSSHHQWPPAKNASKGLAVYLKLWLQKNFAQRHGCPLHAPSLRLDAGRRKHAKTSTAAARTKAEWWN